MYLVHIPGAAISGFPLSCDLAEPGHFSFYVPQTLSVPQQPGVLALSFFAVPSVFPSLSFQALLFCLAQALLGTTRVTELVSPISIKYLRQSLSDMQQMTPPAEGHKYNF